VPITTSFSYTDAVVTATLDILCCVVGEQSPCTVLNAGNRRRTMERYSRHASRYVSTQIWDAHVVIILRRICLPAHHQTRFRRIIGHVCYLMSAFHHNHRFTIRYNTL